MLLLERANPPGPPPHLIQAVQAPRARAGVHRLRRPEATAQPRAHVRPAAAAARPRSPRQQPRAPRLTGVGVRLAVGWGKGGMGEATRGKALGRGVEVFSCRSSALPTSYGISSSSSHKNTGTLADHQLAEEYRDMPW